MIVFRSGCNILIGYFNYKIDVIRGQGEILDLFIMYPANIPQSFIYFHTFVNNIR